ncbi:thioredoxin domain-containing protein [Francisella sp. SYW-9]|uniref:DsbA family protein n=1 Tax=Francisella sp. SYW-9 TaxID=2610888 RepID=UPI00123E2A79|nr:thioredoxin domain-containing protein [Francisella sp. SYW-9]
MKKLTIAISSILLSTSVFAANNTSSNQSFSAQQKEEIGKIAEQYIYEHPEIIIKAAQEIRNKQIQAQQKSMNTAVVSNAKKLLSTKTTPTFGNKDAKVAVIEFFDYECVYCHKEAPAIKKLMDNNKDVKYVFQEFPIFSNHFTGSKLGAEAGFAIYNLYGTDKYMQFHNELFLGKNANKDEGSLKDEDIYNVIKSIKGVDLNKVKEYMRKSSPNLISNSMELGGKLGIQGTPGIIIMPTQNANPSNIRVIPGYAPFNILQQKLNEVKALTK